MTDTNDQGMVDAPAAGRTQLHIIPYLDWVREGYRTFDTQRALLLDILAQLLETFDPEDVSTTIEHFLLGGQTIILDDIASVRDTLLTALATYNKADKLAIGPWYIQADGLLADGESLVRNLLLGQVDAKRHNMTLLNVAYMPQVCQHSAQMPQILRGFGMNAAFLCLGKPMLPLPFRWQAPDGSYVLVTTYETTDSIDTAISEQGRAQPDGPFLWMHAATNPEELQIPPTDTTGTVKHLHSDLTDYIAELREKLPDSLRPTLKGEIHMQLDSPISGRYSARIPQKQDMAHLQADLIHFAEPLLGLALTHGKTRFPEIQRALLEYSWRLLLQNQSGQSIAGAVSDEVFDEISIRSRRIADNTARVINTSITALTGKPINNETTLAPDTAETYLTVWNPHGHAVTQVTELALNLPDGRYPSVLSTPTGEELGFSWDAKTKTIGFLATVPAVGYSVYTLKLTPQQTAGYNQKRIVAGSAIGSASGESLGVNNGNLEWTYDGHIVSDFLTFHDGGDAGDIWQYIEPSPDVVMRGNLVDIVQVEATPTYERLIFRHRMRIAPNLRENGSRSRGLRVLDLLTTATYYHDVPGIHFRTKFSNSAEDHRLRTHIRTGIHAQSIYTDAAFGMVSRPVPSDEKATGIQSMQGVTALHNANRGLAIFTRGLHAYEPLHESGQTTVALTLARAVGWLDKANNIAAKGAQLQNTDLVCDYMLMPLSGEHHPAQLMQQAHSYQAPLRAVQYAEKPATMQHSYLSVDDDRIVMTALKPPQNGDGLIVRLLNPTMADVGLHLTVGEKLRAAHRINLAETGQVAYNIHKGQVNVTLEPHQFVTVQLDFAT